MLNESGDQTIVWSPESDAQMEEIIRKKMAAGVWGRAVKRYRLLRGDISP